MNESKTIRIKGSKEKPVKRTDIIQCLDKLKIDVGSVEYIGEYGDGSDSYVVTFFSHEDASLLKNKFQSICKTSFELDWLGTWPVQNGCRGLEIKIYDGGMEESYIRSCLEDEKYGGGKDSVEEVIFKDEETVVVVFKDSSVLKDILSKNCTMCMKIMKPSLPPLHIARQESDEKKVMFFNIHPNCYAEETKLKSFIENISDSEIDYFIFNAKSSENVCVSLKTSPNYSKILLQTCTRPFNGHMIKVQLMRQTFQIQVGTSCPMSMYDVKSYFSDSKKSGGGPVLEIKFKFDKSDEHSTQFILKYATSDDVDRVCRQQHEINGTKCCATPYYGDVYDNCEWKEDLPPDYDPTKSFLSQPYNTNSLYKGSRTIGIQNLHGIHLKRSDLMTFIRRSRFNENCIEHFEKYHDHVCTITFSTHEDVAIFRNKFISYFKTPVKWFWLETWPSIHACRGMEIKINGGGIDESNLTSFLEDEKYGGVKDSIEEVVFRDDTNAIAVFKKASNLQMLLCKNTEIEFEYATLFLKVMKQQMPPICISNDDFDQRKLIFWSLFPRRYGDEIKLKLFLENITQSEIDYFIFNHSTCDVCVSLKTIPDYSRIMMETCTRPFNGYMIKVEMMHKTYQIQVTTSNLISINEVKSYFSDYTKSGGGPVSKIEFMYQYCVESNEFATNFILEFEKYESIDNVSRRLHEINGIKCCATPYYGKVDCYYGWQKCLPIEFDPTKSHLSKLYIL